MVEAIQNVTLAAGVPPPSANLCAPAKQSTISITSMPAEDPIASFKQLTEPGLSFTVPTRHSNLPITIQNPRRRTTRPNTTGLHYAMLYKNADNLIAAALSFYSAPVTIADMMIGNETFAVSMAHYHFGRHAIVMTRPDEPTVFLSLCNARYHDNELDIYETYTRKALSGKGYSSILSRLAYLIAGQPRRVVMSEVIVTSPLWMLLAKTHVDTGETKPFAHPLFGEYAERIFGVPFVDIEILPRSRIHIKRTRDWKLRVKPRSVFYIGINLDPNS